MSRFALPANRTPHYIVPVRWMATCFALAALVVALFRPMMGAAHPSDTVGDGYAFTTAASGLLETGTRDVLIGAFQLTLGADDPTTDPTAGAAGFIVVTDGEILVTDGDGAPQAILQEGDARYVTADENLTQTARGDNATFWRMSATAWQTGDDLPSDVDAQIAGVVDAPDDALREISFRTAVIPEGVAADLGEAGEQVPLIFALNGSLSLSNGNIIDEDGLAATDGNPVQADGGPVFAGYIAVGAPISSEGNEAGTIDVKPSANSGSNSNGSGSSSGNGDTTTDNGNGNTTTDNGNGNTNDDTTNTKPDLTDLDTDGDDLNDQFELDNGTDPNNPDTDGDGLTDRQELIELGLNSDPLNADTDGDGLSDGEEVNGNPLTRPDNPDSDEDGLPDGVELGFGSSPVNPDTDGDGLLDVQEFTIQSNPNSSDSDGDGFPDLTEVTNGTSPLDPNSH